jgi:hypothetical protein
MSEDKMKDSSPTEAGNSSTTTGGERQEAIHGGRIAVKQVAEAVVRVIWAAAEES